MQPQISAFILLALAAAAYTQRKFMNVTFHPDMMEKANTLHRTQKLNALSKDIQRFARNSPVVFFRKNQVASIVASCNTKLMKTTLKKLVTFFNRRYDSKHGANASKWLLSKVQEVAKTAKPGVEVKVIEFKHPFIQFSIIARIEGQKNQEEAVIIGAHLDSTNSKDHAGRAPGADDDGSGTVSSFEAFRALIDSGFKPKRSIEFHWYAGEEGGFLGSQMHHSDNIDPNLTITLKEIIKQYLPDVTTKDGLCGYGCSDHYSWNIRDYPAVSDNRRIHSVKDTIDQVNFDHALRFTK
ncbi:hypothetical protein BDF19DRAFT_448101 [Syncephalis fuscata]|nr:hypothetical protein BDF19DRAFT_448101 [Syncephalis fuscata]